MSKCVSRLLAAAFVVLLPTLASAQSSAIAGEVKDTSGAVLPGVTVEVTSPALIEKVRTAVTDDAGRYSIIQLVSGVYTVTFTLPGFSTVRRENIELTADFTAPVNAELKVGAIEETITVAAETPIVDVQSITTRTVMTRDILDAIPTRPQHPGGRDHDSGHAARASAAAARCRATSAARATCSSRRSSTAARPTRCRRSKASA